MNFGHVNLPLYKKGTDNFWRVQGVIGVFERSLRKISSGVKNTTYELMSVKHFCNTPKDYLPHYLFIFRKTETLGIYLQNVNYSRLGTMLYLKIKRGRRQ